MNKFLVLFWHNRHLLVFVTKLMFLKYVCQKPMKKNCERPVFSEELQAAINVSKVSLYFNKIPNSLSQTADIFRNMHFLCATKQVLQKQLAKIDLKVTGKSCDEVDGDVTKFML